MKKMAKISEKWQKIQQNGKKIGIFIPGLILLALPFILNAAGLVPCDGPDCNYQSFLELIKKVVNFAVALGIAFSAIVFAWAGFLYLTSGGKDEQVKQAHDMFTKVLWGFLFALGAYLIVQLLTSSLGYKL